MPSPSASSTDDASPRPTLDLVAYGLIVAAIYGVLGPLWFEGARGKLFHPLPDGITKMFQDTFVASFPGTDVAWVCVGLVEAAVVVTLAVSLVRLEFLPSRRKPWLLLSIAASIFAYAVVAFGMTIAGNGDGTASLYTYFATSGVVLILVLLMPPYRPRAWLTGFTNR